MKKFFSICSILALALTLSVPAFAANPKFLNRGGVYADQLASQLTAAATISANFDLGSIFTLTPAQAETINATGGVPGEHYALVITTSGTTSYTITFGTNFKSNGTLVTGTADAITYSVHFVYDGVNFVETKRERAGSSAIALTPAATIALGAAEGATVYTWTPGEDETINAAVVERAGRRFTAVITTSGATSRTLTFSTGFKVTGTLATGTSTAKVFAISFVSDGTNWNEVSRTAAM